MTDQRKSVLSKDRLQNSVRKIKVNNTIIPLYDISDRKLYAESKYTFVNTDDDNNKTIVLIKEPIIYGEIIGILGIAFANDDFYLWKDYYMCHIDDDTQKLITMNSELFSEIITIMDRLGRHVVVTQYKEDMTSLSLIAPPNIITDIQQKTNANDFI